jgi:hypothetical protein
MCGSYYFKALPRIFQRFISSRSTVHARRLQAPIASASATPDLGGTLNHPRRAPTAFGTASHRLPPSRLSGSESAESSVIPNRTATLSIELNQAQGTIAEVSRLVGRDSMMAACLIASLPIAIIDNI